MGGGGGWLGGETLKRDTTVRLFNGKCVWLITKADSVSIT